MFSPYNLPSEYERIFSEKKNVTNKTRKEKMEMKGEKINIHAFQKNIEEELGEVISDGYKRRKVLSDKKARQVKELQEEIKNWKN